MDDKPIKIFGLDNYKAFSQLSDGQLRELALSLRGLELANGTGWIEFKLTNPSKPVLVKSETIGPGGEVWETWLHYSLMTAFELRRRIKYELQEAEGRVLDPKTKQILSDIHGLVEWLGWIAERKTE